METLILASGSRYRKHLLQRLQIPFSVLPPDIDESPLSGEPAIALAERLAATKAEIIGRDHPGSVVIGSDQVALLDEALLGKPGTVANAEAQLALCSGRVVEFFTAVCVYWDGAMQQTNVPYQVEFRELTSAEIKRYVELEQPLDCAGSFKCEGLGSTLFRRLNGEDPTALEGLPLIALSSMLRHWGIDPLQRQV
ncbi:septum formation protein Maf [Halieaceae bacterium IMCC14734]|uniref:7-methyl-GTP pyrophosphatase n=1 Tax=Candidatus Litorirhabdus singularis TaxID=2518993 RepID=A0ABT3TGE7_9GAMM|nr:Maf family nucleotide pyrophosphatase [Candidatus Litorirhabdus singularis]MCX2981382.1 septum formation protein Maf [Candidatus Litorirhabdus singularis]